MRWTRALAFFTAALVLVAGLQFLAMRGQLSVMKGTLREMQTADAITKSQISARMEFEIHRQEEVVGQTVVAWSVTPVWKNTGQTDALDFFGLDNIKYFPGNSASSFDFASFPKQPKGIVPATITSKQWISQPTRVISRTEAIKAAAGDGTIIFWGYARWRDIFPDVPPHFHSWCALLHFSMANGQPIMTLPVYYEAQCNRSH